MAGKAGLKAGLIGAVVMTGAVLVNHLLLTIGGNMALSLTICGVTTLLYAGIGALAGFFVAPPRTAGKGAAAGAIAGLIGGAISVTVGVILILTGVSKALDPQQMQQLAELGMNPALITLPSAVCGMGAGSGAAAAGGAILAAVRSD